MPTVADASFGEPLSVVIEGFDAATADFNGDGKLDVVTGVNGTGILKEVDVYLGKGDGTFLPKMVVFPTTVAVDPLAVVAGEFNGDGKPDIAFGESGSVSVLLGNGDGTFLPRTSTMFPYGQISSMRSLDLNGDGKLDLVIGRTSGNKGFVHRLISVGDGAFSLADPIEDRTPVAAGDFNGDGKLDLVLSQPLTVFVGAGDGSFTPGSNIPADKSTGGVVAADFNGDGKLDLASGAVSPDDMNTTGSVHVGVGDGTFQATIFLKAGSFLTRPDLAADFNGDGKTDILVRAGTTTDFAIQVGFGDGSFSSKGPTIKTDDHTVMKTLVGDFNGDGKPDVAVIGFSNPYTRLLVFLNTSP